MAAFYKNNVAFFINEANNSIIGTLTQQSGLAGFVQQLHTQTYSWDNEITILKSSLNELSKTLDIAKAGILLEYPIARRAKRIDIVLIINGIIIIIEFKSGKSQYENADKDQLVDYCLDLRDFHFESRDKVIVPLLLASDAKNINNLYKGNGAVVKPIIFANSTNLTECLINILKQGGSSPIDYLQWDRSIYSPTPTIIEAAQALYAGKSVAEISNNQAGKENLTTTTKAVVDAIKYAKKHNKKVICFITGVPGAGKTLAGLNIAHDEEFQTEEHSLATFLSGNGPLIQVLREALKRDAFSKLKADNKDAKAKEVARIIAFIENVHRFLDEYFLAEEKTPNNKIVIFDEAQRAWNAEHSMRKFQRPFSEAEMMLNVMDRHRDWSVIVALIGSGQEINTGEAGLPEWGKVISNKFKHWEVYISSLLKNGTGSGHLTLFNEVPENLKIVENPSLHLDIDIRSYKGEGLSKWVSAVLSNDSSAAKQILEAQLKTYKIALTRDLNKAKAWLKERCEGTRRMGLVASSGARRLRPYGLDVRTELEVAEWFLNPKSDVRSSYYLETPATEFGIQGLELDWVGVCWDADLRRTPTSWDFKAFKGSKWMNENKLEKRTFILNKYRVLLTRSREGMVIFVPQGDDEDLTRNPIDYNEIANYLKACGLEEF
jgi:hypothetical protein